MKRRSVNKFLSLLLALSMLLSMLPMAALGTGEEPAPDTEEPTVQVDPNPDSGTEPGVGEDDETPPPSGEDDETPPPSGGEDDETPPPSGGEDDETPPPDDGEDDETPPPDDGEEVALLDGDDGVVTPLGSVTNHTIKFNADGTVSGGITIMGHSSNAKVLVVLVPNVTCSEWPNPASAITGAMNSLNPDGGGYQNFIDNAVGALPYMAYLGTTSTDTQGENTEEMTIGGTLQHHRGNQTITESALISAAMSLGGIANPATPPYTYTLFVACGQGTTTYVYFNDIAIPDGKGAVTVKVDGAALTAADAKVGSVTLKDQAGSSPDIACAAAGTDPNFAYKSATALVDGVTYEVYVNGAATGEIVTKAAPTATVQTYTLTLAVTSAGSGNRTITINDPSGPGKATYTASNTNAGSVTRAYPAGAVVGIEAAGTAGSAFSEWSVSGGGSIGNTKTYQTTYQTLDSDSTVTATFGAQGNNGVRVWIYLDGTLITDVNQLPTTAVTFRGSAGELLQAQFNSGNGDYRPAAATSAFSGTTYTVYVNGYSTGVMLTGGSSAVSEGTTTRAYIYTLTVARGSTDGVVQYSVGSTVYTQSSSTFAAFPTGAVVPLTASPLVGKALDTWTITAGGTGASLNNETSPTNASIQIGTEAVTATASFKTATDEVRVNTILNGSQATVSPAVVQLKDASDNVKYTLADSGGTGAYTFAAPDDGTYNIWVNGLKSTQTVTVAGSNGTASVHVFTVAADATVGSGKSSIIYGGSVLEVTGASSMMVPQGATVKAKTSGTLAADYSAGNWSVAPNVGSYGTTGSGSEFSYTAPNDDTSVPGTGIKLTANYTYSSSKFDAEVTTYVDGTPKNAGEVEVVFSGSDRQKVDSSANGVYTFTNLNKGNTYSVYVNGMDTGKTVDQNNTTIDVKNLYTVVTAKAHTGGDGSGAIGVPVYSYSLATNSAYEVSRENVTSRVLPGNGATLTLTAAPHAASTPFYRFDTDKGWTKGLAGGTLNNPTVEATATYTMPAISAGDASASITLTANYIRQYEVTLTNNPAVTGVTLQVDSGSSPKKVDYNATNTAISATETNSAQTHTFKEWVVPGTATLGSETAHSTTITSISSDVIINATYYTLPTLAISATTYNNGPGVAAQPPALTLTYTAGDNGDYASNTVSGPSSYSTPLTAADFTGSITLPNSGTAMTFDPDFLDGLAAGAYIITFEDTKGPPYNKSVTLTISTTKAKLTSATIVGEGGAGTTLDATDTGRDTALNAAYTNDGYSGSEIPIGDLRWDWYYTNAGAAAPAAAATTAIAATSAATAVATPISTTTTGTSPAIPDDAKGRHVFAVVKVDSGSVKGNSTYAVITNAIPVDYDAEITVNKNGTDIGNSTAFNLLLKATDQSDVALTSPTAGVFTTENGGLVGGVTYQIWARPAEGSATLVNTGFTIQPDNDSGTTRNKKTLDYYTVTIGLVTPSHLSASSGGSVEETFGGSYDAVPTISAEHGGVPLTGTTGILSGQNVKFTTTAWGQDYLLTWKKGATDATGGDANQTSGTANGTGYTTQINSQGIAIAGTLQQKGYTVTGTIVGTPASAKITSATLTAGSFSFTASNIGTGQNGATVTFINIPHSTVASAQSDIKSGYTISAVADGDTSISGYKVPAAAGGDPTTATAFEVEGNKSGAFGIHLVGAERKLKVSDSVTGTDSDAEVVQTGGAGSDQTGTRTIEVIWGYSTAPATTTVTLENTGNRELSVTPTFGTAPAGLTVTPNMTSGTSFDLAEGADKIFTIAANTGLAYNASPYTWSIDFAAEDKTEALKTLHKLTYTFEFVVNQDTVGTVTTNLGTTATAVGQTANVTDITSGTHDLDLLNTYSGNVSYQWYRADSEAAANAAFSATGGVTTNGSVVEISGETNASYQLAADDAGKYVFVVVSGTNNVKDHAKSAYIPVLYDGYVEIKADNGQLTGSDPVYTVYLLANDVTWAGPSTSGVISTTWVGASTNAYKTDSGLTPDVTYKVYTIPVSGVDDTDKIVYSDVTLTQDAVNHTTALDFYTVKYDTALAVSNTDAKASGAIAATTLASQLSAKVSSAGAAADQAVANNALVLKNTEVEFSVSPGASGGWDNNAEYTLSWAGNGIALPGTLTGITTTGTDNHAKKFTFSEKPTYSGSGVAATLTQVLYTVDFGVTGTGSASITGATLTSKETGSTFSDAATPTGGTPAGGNGATVSFSVPKGTYTLTAAPSFGTTVDYFYWGGTPSGKAPASQEINVTANETSTTNNKIDLVASTFGVEFRTLMDGTTKLPNSGNEVAGAFAVPTGNLTYKVYDDAGGSYASGVTYTVRVYNTGDAPIPDLVLTNSLVVGEFTVSSLAAAAVKNAADGSEIAALRDFTDSDGAELEVGAYVEFTVTIPTGKDAGSYNTTTPVSIAASSTLVNTNLGGTTTYAPSYIIDRAKITAVAVTGITPPRYTSGPPTALDTDAIATTSAASGQNGINGNTAATTTAPAVTWQRGSVSVSGDVEPGASYTATVELTADANHVFDSTQLANFTILTTADNGTYVDVTISGSSPSDNTLTLLYTFAPTVPTLTVALAPTTSREYDQLTATPTRGADEAGTSGLTITNHYQVMKTSDVSATPDAATLGAITAQAGNPNFEGLEELEGYTVYAVTKIVDTHGRTVYSEVAEDDAQTWYKFTVKLADTSAGRGNIQIDTGTPATSITIGVDPNSTTVSNLNAVIAGPGFEFVNWTTAEVGGATGTISNANSDTTTFTVTGKSQVLSANFKTVDLSIANKTDTATYGANYTYALPQNGSGLGITNGNGSYTYSISGNPDWLTYNASEHRLEGIPETVGTIGPVTIHVTDGKNDPSYGSFTLTITVEKGVITLSSITYDNSETWYAGNAYEDGKLSGTAQANVLTAPATVSTSATWETRDVPGTWAFKNPGVFLENTNDYDVTFTPSGSDHVPSPSDNSIQYDDVYAARDGKVSIAAMGKQLGVQIAPDTITIPADVFGTYNAPTATFTVRNTGNQDASSLTYQFSAQTGSFAPTVGTAPTTLDAGDTSSAITITAVPNTLDVGTYTATLTVAGISDGVDVSDTATVTFTVKPQPITSAAITELSAPIVGNVLDTTVTKDATNGANYTVTSVVWDPSEIAVAGKSYKVTVTLTAESNYYFDALADDAARRAAYTLADTGATYTLDSVTVGNSSGGTVASNTVTLVYTFPATPAMMTTVDAIAATTDGHAKGVIQTISATTSESVKFHYIVTAGAATAIDAGEVRTVATTAALTAGTNNAGVVARGTSTAIPPSGTTASWTSIPVPSLSAGTTYYVYAIAVPAGAGKGDALSNMISDTFVTDYAVHVEYKDDAAQRDKMGINITPDTQGTPVYVPYGTKLLLNVVTITGNKFNGWEVKSDGTGDGLFTTAGAADATGGFSTWTTSNDAAFWPTANSTVTADFGGVPRLIYSGQEYGDQVSLSAIDTQNERDALTVWKNGWVANIGGSATGTLGVRVINENDSTYGTYYGAGTSPGLPTGQSASPYFDVKVSSNPLPALNLARPMDSQHGLTVHPAASLTSAGTYKATVYIYDTTMSTVYTAFDVYITLIGATEPVFHPVTHTYDKNPDLAAVAGEWGISNNSDWTITATLPDDTWSVTSLTLTSVNSTPETTLLTPSTDYTVTGWDSTTATITLSTIYLSGLVTTRSLAHGDTVTFELVTGSTSTASKATTLTLTIIDTVRNIDSATIVGPVAAGGTIAAPVVTASNAAGATYDASDKVSYQWYKADSAAEVGTGIGTDTNISGATNATYTVQQGDEGKFIYVVVTADADGYAGSEESNAVQVAFKVTVVTDPASVPGTTPAHNASVNVNPGSATTLIANNAAAIAAGYYFTGWEVDGNPANGTFTNDTAATTSFTPIANAVVTANFDTLPTLAWQNTLEPTPTNSGKDYTFDIGSKPPSPQSLAPVLVYTQNSGSGTVDVTIKQGGTTQVLTQGTDYTVNGDEYTLTMSGTNLVGKTGTWTVIFDEKGAGKTDPAYDPAVTLVIERTMRTFTVEITGTVEPGATLTAATTDSDDSLKTVTATYAWYWTTTPGATTGGTSLGYMSKDYTIPDSDTWAGRYIYVVATGTGDYLGTTVADVTDTAITRATFDITVRAQTGKGTVNANGGSYAESVTVNGAGKGLPISVNAVAAQGYAFDTWAVTGGSATGTLTNASTTLTPTGEDSTGSLVFEAQFTAVPLTPNAQTVTAVYYSNAIATQTPAAVVTGGTGSYSYAVKGSLPAELAGWLEVNPTTGAVTVKSSQRIAYGSADITTTPYNFEVTVTDTNSGVTTDVTYTVDISKANIVFAGSYVYGSGPHYVNDPVNTAYLTGGQVNGATGETNLAGTWATSAPTLSLANMTVTFTFDPTNPNYNTNTLQMGISSIAAAERLSVFDDIGAPAEETLTFTYLDSTTPASIIVKLQNSGTNALNEVKLILDDTDVTDTNDFTVTYSNSDLEESAAGISLSSGEVVDGATIGANYLQNREVGDISTLKITASGGSGSAAASTTEYLVHIAITPATIASAEITELTLPDVGTPLGGSVGTLSNGVTPLSTGFTVDSDRGTDTNNNYNYKEPNVSWSYDGLLVVNPTLHNIVEGTIYTATITLQNEKNYRFDPGGTYTVNGSVQKTGFTVSATQTEVQFVVTMAPTPLRTVSGTVTAPADGASGGTPTVPYGAKYGLDTYEWKDKDGNAFGGTFTAGEKYTLSMTVAPNSPYVFDDEADLIGLINGFAATDISKDGSGNVTIKYEFTATGGGGGGTIIGGGGGGGSTAKPFIVDYVVPQFGTTVDPTIELVNKGASPVSVPKVIANPGYAFAGWSYEKDNVDDTKDPALVEPTKAIIEKDTTFYAIYKLTVKPHARYIKGYPEGIFAPGDNITRAEVATIIARAILKDFQEGNDYGNGGYTDVKDTHWARSAIAYCTMHGVFTGMGDGIFQPDRKITRQEFALVFARLLGILDAGSLPFSDIGDADSWALQGIYTAYEGGLVVGYTDGTFKPQDNIRRDEAVTIVNRYLKRGVDADGLKEVYGDLKLWPDVPETHWAFYEVLEASNDHAFNYVDGVQPPEFWTALSIEIPGLGS